METSCGERAFLVHSASSHQACLTSRLLCLPRDRNLLGRVTCWAMFRSA